MTGGLFGRFLATYQPDPEASAARPPVAAARDLPSGRGVSELLTGHGGRSFNGAVYRLHAPDSLARWSAVAEDAFPDYRGRVACFGMDWLGRQFALDSQRRRRGEPLVLLLEPGTGEALEIPATFESFHNEILVDEPEAAVAAGFFAEWRDTGGPAPEAGRCIGYKVPLFLGGADDVANLEPIDAEVYWSICGQLWNQTRDLPAGTTIRSLSTKR